VSTPIPRFLCSSSVDAAAMGADGKTSREERRKQRELEEGRKVRAESIARASGVRRAMRARRADGNGREVTPAALGEELTREECARERERTND